MDWYTDPVTGQHKVIPKPDTPRPPSQYERTGRSPIDLRILPFQDKLTNNIFDDNPLIPQGDI